MDDLYSTPKNNKPKPTSPPPLKRSRDYINEEDDESNMPPKIKRAHRKLLPEFISGLTRPPHLSIFIPAYTPRMVEWSDPRSENVSEHRRSHDDPVASHASSSAASSSAASFSVSFSSVSVETADVKQLILRLNNLKVDPVKKNQ